MAMVTRNTLFVVLFNISKAITFIDYFSTLVRFFKKIVSFTTKTTF